MGIHSGAVVAGLIGPDNRIEYGVVGDAVNLASRVEALTREMQATILVSRDISAQLGPSLRARPHCHDAGQGQVPAGRGLRGAVLVSTG